MDGWLGAGMIEEFEGHIQGQKEGGGRTEDGGGEREQVVRRR